MALLVRMVTSAMLVVAFGWVVSGCNSGRRNERTGPPPPPVNCGTDAVPFLIESSQPQGCAGDTMTLDGVNFSLEPSDNIVTFVSNDQLSSTTAEVVQVVDNGLSQRFPGCQSTTLFVTVPSGTRTGSVQVEVRQPDGAVVSAGVRPFTACPEIWSFGVGLDADGFLAWDMGSNLLNDQLQLFGINLESVTGVNVTDPIGNRFINFDVAPVGLMNPSYSLPPGVSVATVTMDNALVPDCEAFYFQLELVSNLTGQSQVSNEILIPIRRSYSPTDLEPLPGTVTGAIVPPGVRTGVIPISYRLLAEPAQETYDVSPQYFDPDSMSWLDCTPLVSGDGMLQLPGVGESEDVLGSLVGGGATHTFYWDSSADVFGQTQTVSLRFPVEENAVAPGTCPTSFDDDALYHLPLMAVANPLDGADLGAHAGSLVEKFKDTRQFQSGSAEWNESASGQLFGPSVTPGDPEWGTGTFEVVLESERDYIFNTNTGGLFDVTKLTMPTQLAVGQPGAGLREFHFRTLIIDPLANVSVEGDSPLVIRLSGGGGIDETVGVFAGALSLDGAAGTAGTPMAPGVGGASGIGGGAGGAAAVIDLLPDETVAGEAAASRGENYGGFPGQSVTFVRIGDASSPRAGAGGGGGCRVQGGSGTGTATAATEQARQGAGGPARGDRRLLNLVGGSGGGGGGSSLRRGLPGSPVEIAHGGGGGGGGGSLRVVANGALEISGALTANGGNGGDSSQALAGPGGGGSGGTIHLSASGDLRILNSALISAIGGRGERSSASGVLVSGDGSDGRVRLEAGGQTLFPSVGDFELVAPPIDDVATTHGVVAPDVVDSGTGLDGVLDLYGPVGTIYIVDTDLGTVSTLSGATVATRSVDDTDFHLSELYIREGIFLQAIGAKPLVLRVRDFAQIDGVIDVSGEDGGIPNVEELFPTAGEGGRGGPGSSAGGAGGVATSKLAFVNGQDGLLDHLEPFGLLDPASPFGGSVSPGSPFPMPLVTRARGGETATDSVVAQAGSGGGGGYSADGVDGTTISTMPEFGDGGSAYGSRRFMLVPNSIDPLPVGGGSGGGGGGNVVSEATSPFPSAPGSGGGGGGGYCQISVGQRFVVSRTASILARGGDAFRAPLRAGNGGAGAGGGVFLQSAGVFGFSGTVDVTGGEANRTPTDAAYSANSEFDAGGDGSNGRIRIEVSTGFLDEVAFEIQPNPSFGPYLGGGRSLTTALSKAYPLTVGSGLSSSGAIQFGAAEIQANVPSGSELVVLYSGARYSLDGPGAIDEFVGWVDDPQLLDEPEFVQLQFYLFNGGMPPTVDSFELPYTFLP